MSAVAIAITVGLAVWLALAAVVAFVLSWAWGLFAPALGLPSLDFIQAFGLLLVVSILGRLLFGGRGK